MVWTWMLFFCLAGGNSGETCSIWRMEILNNFVVLAILLAFGTSLGGCTYLESTLQQARLSAQFSDTPSQRVYKHMLSADNFFVYGKIGNGIGLNQQALAVVAVSSLHQEHEVVDVSHFPGLDSFYGLNLPPGEFQLLVFSDFKLAPL